jgi:drug/metabolite transporter (DMT)-like permease
MAAFMKENKRFTGVLLGLAATSFWASFYIVGRFLFGEDEAKIDPVFLTFVRYLVASMLLTGIMLYQKKMAVVKECLKKDLVIFIFLGLTGIVGEGTLVFYSLKYTTAARSCLLANASPVFTVLMAYFALNEGMSKSKTAGMLLGFAGISAAILCRGGSDAYMSASAVIGDLMALASGVCWAAYTVWGMRVSNQYGGMVSGTVSILLGTVLMLPVVMLSGSNLSLDLPLRVWLGVIYLGVFANGIAYMCWFAALKHLKAGELGAFGYVSAAMTMGCRLSSFRKKSASYSWPRWRWYFTASV